MHETICTGCGDNLAVDWWTRLCEACICDVRGEDEDADDCEIVAWEREGA